LGRNYIGGFVHGLYRGDYWLRSVEIVFLCSKFFAEEKWKPAAIAEVK